MESLNRKIVLPLTGLALLAGAAGTYAATKDSGESAREAFFEDAAKKLDVTPAELKSALREAAKENGLPGRPPFGHHGPGGFGHHGPGGPIGHSIDTAADYLGLKPAELFAKLRDGKSLAEVAKAQDKSVDGLKDAIRKTVADELDEEVKEEDLTDAQRDEMLKRFDEHIDDLIAGKLPDGPRFDGDGPPGFHDGDGPPGFDDDDGPPRFRGGEGPGPGFPLAPAA